MAMNTARDATPGHRPTWSTLDETDRLEWSGRIARALEALKADQAELGRKARMLAAGAVPLAATLAGGCGYTPTYPKASNPNEVYTATTLTSAAPVYRPEAKQTSEEQAEYEQRAEREMQERQARAASADQPAAAAAQGTAPGSEERAAYVQALRDALADLDANVDDVRTRAAMAGPKARAGADEALKVVSQRRAQLELAKKRVEQATGDDWRRARDEIESLLDAAKQNLRLARDRAAASSHE